MVRKRQEDLIMATLASLKDQLAQVDEATKRMHQGLQALEGDLKEFRGVSEERFTELTSQAKTCREHLDFLMQATEMIKRRAREQSKSVAGSLKDLGDGQETLKAQLASLERALKRQERDVRATERSARTLVEGTAIVPATDPNDRLRGVLEQLERIADADGPPSNPLRPALPAPSKATALEQDLASLPRFAGSAGPAPIDTARGPSSARSAYSLSPRGQSARARKKR